MNAKFFFFKFIVVVSILIYSGCTTDFETRAPYKNIPVVSAIFTQQTRESFISNDGDEIRYFLEDVLMPQTFKVTKVFQGNGNYFEYAKIWDSIYYPEGTIDVSVEVTSNRGGTRLLQCTREIIANKQEGTFYFPQQEVFSLDKSQAESVEKPNNKLNESTILKLKVYNKNRKEEAYAITGLIPDFPILVDAVGSASAVYVSFDLSKPNVNTRITVNNLGPNCGRVSATFTYIYYETDLFTNVTTEKKIIWDLGHITIETQTANYSIKNRLFFEFLTSSIPANPNVKRESSNDCYIEVQAYSQDLNSYIIASDPANSSFNNQLSYTNLKNGIGIFGSKLIKTKAFHLNQTTKNQIKEVFKAIDHSFD